MKLKSERIIGLVLLGIFVFLIAKLQPFLQNIFEVVNQDYGYDRPIKAIMLSALCLSFVVGIKLIINRK